MFADTLTLLGLPPEHVALLVLGGAAAGFVNAIAGGGSALTLPLFVLVGLDATLANGTNRIGVLVQSAAATSTFHRKGVRPWPLLGRLFPVVLAGAALGAWTAANLPPLQTERALAVVFVLLAGVTLARPGWLDPPTEDAPAKPGAGAWAAAFVAAYFGGLFQVGVGILLLLVLARGFGVDLVRANAVKVGIVFSYTFAVIAVFAWHGEIAWVPGLVAAVGGLIGSVAGAHAAVERGAPFVRKVLVAALIAAALRFAGVF